MIEHTEGGGCLCAACETRRLNVGYIMRQSEATLDHMFELRDKLKAARAEEVVTCAALQTAQDADDKAHEHCREVKKEFDAAVEDWLESEPEK